MNYYTSDTHFFHDKIIRLCNRPFDNLEEMHREIIKRWNSKVSPEDTVYFLGDFAFTCKDTQAIKEVIGQLNGQKVIIKGNHEFGFDDYSVRKAGNVLSVQNYLEINDNGKKVVLFHYPIEDWNGRWRGAYHLYGHIHNSQHCIALPEHIRRFNVGMDVHDFYPVTLNELITSRRGKENQYYEGETR